MKVYIINFNDQHLVKNLKWPLLLIVNYIK
jgi:hypothetical protein